MDDTRLSVDEEIEQLRAENAGLREQLEGGGRLQRPKSRWRWPLAVVLLLLGGIALAASTLVVWTGRTLLDADRYVETVTPLIDSPAIRSSLARRSTESIFGSLDLESRAREALPPRADFLAPSIASNLEAYAQKAAENILATPQARELWVNANRRSHERIMPALLGEAQSPYVDVSQGTVSLDVTEIVSRVKAGLGARGITITQQVPDNVAGGSFTLLESPRLANVQAALQFLRSATVWLPVLMLLVFGGAIAVAPDRRRAAFWLGIVAIGAMLALAVGLAFLRQTYVASGSRLVLDATAASVLFDTLFRFLRNAIRVVAALGLVVALAAALAGPSKVARQIRGTTTEGLGSISRGLNLGGFSEWVERHNRALNVLGVVVAAIVLLAVDTPTPGLIAGLALGVVVWLLVVEVLAHAHGGSPPTGQPTT